MNPKDTHLYSKTKNLLFKAINLKDEIKLIDQSNEFKELLHYMKKISIHFLLKTLK